MAHYLNLPTDERIYGVGEKAGKLERTGRSFEMVCIDALGYDAEHTDPLYKHIPITLSRTPHGHIGLLYDNLARGWFDLGRSIDNYHARFRSWRAEGGDIDYYLVIADQMAALTRRLTELTGRPAFPPRWSLGYSQSTMTYPDMPDAQDQLIAFAERCREHRVPIGSFQMGSGYTTIGTKRYLFNWNRDKFPDPRQVSDHFHAAGMGFTANIKPCLLLSHPRYAEAAEAGLFVRNGATGAPEVSQFWDEMGSHLDFTNPDTVAWWQEGCTRQLLDYGIDAPWNDNNEFQIWDDNAVCAGFGRPIPAGLVRPLLGLLMTRASYEAQQAYAPGKRPFSVTRSGPPGLQRYAQTWSGDNRSDWGTLRHNIAMGLSMALCGISNVGHDVGGFAGERPDPELFVRWVQNGAMHPRFTFNSWHSDGSVNEPWMHPEVLDEVRAAIELRARLTPYFYDLLHRSHTWFEPMIRPMFFVDESDERLWEETADFMLGGDLLVASVVEPGATERLVYLPRNPGGWYEFDTGVHHDGGGEVILDAPLNRLPLLVRAGAAVPVGEVPAQRADWPDDRRTLLVFPPAVGDSAQGSWYEDDGESVAGPSLTTSWTMRADEQSVRVDIEFTGDHQPGWRELEVRLPATEFRRLEVTYQVSGSASIAAR